MRYEAKVALKSKYKVNQSTDWRAQNKTWNEKMEYLYETKFESDINFRINTKSGNADFKAHRFALCMSSEVLSAILKAELLKIPGQATVVLSNVDPEAFEQFLKFIYTGKTEFKNANNAIEVYRVAERFNVAELAERSYEYIEKNVTPQNVMQVYIFADVHELDELKQKCVYIIQHKTKQVINEGNVAKMDVESLVAILDQPNLAINEIDLFHLVQNWMKACETTDLCAFSSGQGEDLKRKLQHVLLSRFRFKSMTQEEFIKGPMSTGMMCKEDELAILGNIISKDCALKYPKCYNPNPRKRLDSEERRVFVKSPSKPSQSPSKPSQVNLPQQETSKEKSESPPEEPSVSSSPSPPKKSKDPRKRTSSMYRADREGTTPPPTIGVQQVSSVVPPYLNQLVKEKAKKKKAGKSRTPSSTKAPTE